MSIESELTQQLYFQANRIVEDVIAEFSANGADINWKAVTASLLRLIRTKSEEYIA